MDSKTKSQRRLPSMPWDWLNFCFHSPSSEGERLESKHDRASKFAIKNKSVEDDFEIGDELGRGSFGLVKTGIHRRNRKKCALKFVFRKGLSRKDEELFLTEADILTGLSHENIVEMRDFYKWELAYCLAMEHMEGGELCEDIMRRVFYSEACARRIILQIMQALAYLHQRGICHRDIKPENLLLRKRGEERIKLADFGLASVLRPPLYKVVEPVGSPGYAAPEVLRLIPYDGKADVFSLGVIAFVLLSGYLPFGGASPAEAVKNTLNGNPSFDNIQWSSVSEGGKNFVQSLLTPEQDKRPTAEKAIFHPWMKVHGGRLLTRPLSDRRSGISKPLLEEFQNVQRQRLKAAADAVVAVNRLQAILAPRHDADAVNEAGNGGGGHQKQIYMEANIAEEEMESPPLQAKTLGPNTVEAGTQLVQESGRPQCEEAGRQNGDGDSVRLAVPVLA